MSLHRLTTRTVFGAALFTLTFTGQAALAEEKAANTAAPLAPAQVNAVRAIAVSVLAAKNSGAHEAPEDSGYVVRLRELLDQWIVAELNLDNRIPITLAGQGTAANQANEKAKAAVRAQAQKLAKQLRARAAVLVAKAKAGDKAASAQLALHAQRAQLFKRWAGQLGEILASKAPDRGVRLMAFRERLQPRQRLTDAPHEPGTPTLQILPANRLLPVQNIVTE